MATIVNAERARDEYGFWLSIGPGNHWYVYVPVGVDPSDGAPLTQVRQAQPDEVEMWRAGRLIALQSLLLARGAPLMAVPRKTVWSRAKDAVARAIGWKH